MEKKYTAGRNPAIDSMGNQWPMISGGRRISEEKEKQKAQESQGSRGSESSRASQSNRSSQGSRVSQSGQRPYGTERKKAGSVEAAAPRRSKSQKQETRQRAESVNTTARRRRAAAETAATAEAAVMPRARRQERVLKKFPVVPMAICAGVVAAIGLILFLWLGQKGDTSLADTSQGIQYLAALEQRDTEAIYSQIKEVKKKERREALENGDVSVWSLFYDYAILGDSRGVGFSYYELLDENRVFAEAGNTIAVVPDRLEALRALNPENIFLCYGINDVSIGLYDTPEIYQEEMDKTVQLLQQEFPSANIYVNSIFPAQDPAFETSEKWREIPDYNVAVKAMCEEKGYHYIDNTPVYEEHADLYDPDGIHFQKVFYDYWAANMIAEMDPVEE